MEVSFSHHVILHLDSSIAIAAKPVHPHSCIPVSHDFGLGIGSERRLGFRLQPNLEPKILAKTAFHVTY
jgi:hypothetical protein